MIKRTLSSIFLLLILSCAIYFGNALGFSILIFILALLASYEACQIEKKCGLSPRYWVVASLVSLVFCIRIGEMYGIILPSFLSPSILLILFLIASLKNPYGDYPTKTLLPEFLTVMTLGFLLSYFVQIAFICGVKIAVWAILVIKFSDIGGYIFGCTFGKNRVAPTISPKKSYEGLVGSIFLSSVGAMAIAHYFILESFSGVPIWLLGVIGAVIAVLALLSDLVESALKRKAGVKDSGNTLPGIGGALDLADSLILTTPIFTIILSVILSR